MAKKALLNKFNSFESHDAQDSYLLGLISIKKVEHRRLKKNSDEAMRRELCIIIIIVTRIFHALLIVCEGGGKEGELDLCGLILC